MLEEIKKLFNLKNSLNQELVDHIIIYLRKSRKDAEYGKDEPIEKTLQRHEDMLQEWAKNIFGCKIPSKNILREVVSGDSIIDRPQMQKLLELVESDEIKGVLCIEIERLARGNTIDQGTIAQKFQLTNTIILTPNKIFNLDDEYDMSYFEDGLHQARKYLQYTKKILSRGREQSIKEGKYPVSTPLFGYDKKKLKNEKGYTLIKNEDSKTIRKLFDLYLYDDFGTTLIAKKLNLLDLKSPTGVPWTAAMIRSRLDRAEIYAGYVIWNKRKIVKKYINNKIVVTRPVNKDYIRIKGLHEPIITEEELSLIEQKMKKLSVKTIPNDHEIQNPLAGIVKCGFCGKNMQRRPYTKSFVKSGIVHKDTLICTNLKCKNISSDLEIVEQKLLDYLKIKLNDYELYAKNYNKKVKNIIPKLREEKDKFINKINQLNHQKMKCCEFLENGTYDEETFKVRINLLNKEINEINDLIKDLDSQIDKEENHNYNKAIPKLKKCINLYEKSTVKEKNMLLSSIVKNVYYKKTNNKGRWDKNARTDFQLVVELYY